MVVLWSEPPEESTGDLSLSAGREQIVPLLQENRRLRKIGRTWAERLQILRETVQALKHEIARLTTLLKRPKFRAGGGRPGRPGSKRRIRERREAQAETNLPIRLVVKYKKKL